MFRVVCAGFGCFEFCYLAIVLCVLFWMAVGLVFVEFVNLVI